MYAKKLVVGECQITLHIPETTPEDELNALHQFFQQMALDISEERSHADGKIS